MSKYFCDVIKVIGFMFAFCSSLALADDKNTVEISTQLGSLLGIKEGDVRAFYDIPYAKNPFADGRRFQAPQAYGKWRGVLDATELGLPVPQPGRGKNIELVGAPGNLSLNIWVPKEAFSSDKKLPVMVWIPGGAFYREDAGQQAYKGNSFANNGIIVVTVNYRVGVDGFLHLDGAPDNRGILDQIMALQWVHKNIGDFGGDNKQVTLFGQSAGAESVAILLGSKTAQGLFQRAIMQSPPMQFFTQQEAARIAGDLAGELGVPATIEGMSKIPYSKLVDHVVAMNSRLSNREDWGMLSWGGSAFLPVVDNKLIISSVMQTIENNVDPSIPVIIGSTDQESRLYMVPSGAIDRVTNDKVLLFLGDLALNSDSLKVYSDSNSKRSIGDIYVDILSDYTFRIPALRMAETLVNNGNKVWYYNFSWRSPAFGGKLGAAHFVDVPFSFNTLYSTEAKTFLGKEPPKSLAESMHTQWASFAKSASVNWSLYDLDTRPTMRFDNASQQVNDPGKAVRKLWKNYTFQ